MCSMRASTVTRVGPASTIPAAAARQLQSLTLRRKQAGCAGALTRALTVSALPMDSCTSGGMVAPLAAPMLLEPEAVCFT